jgi:AcrR family transcriptional regulator
MNSPRRKTQPYHHGDLKNALLDSARSILEQKGLAALTLRAVARKARVSHAAPYRHFKNLDALLVELAREGFAALQAQVAEAAAAQGEGVDRITHIGAAYMRFVAGHPALARLMFGPQLRNRARFPQLAEAADGIGVEIGRALNDPVLGVAAWAAVHGLAVLTLENVIDLGQHSAGSNVLPSRAEILLRSLFSIGAG